MSHDASRTRTARRRYPLALVALILAAALIAVRGDAQTEPPGQFGLFLPAAQTVGSLNLLSPGSTPAVGLAGDCLKGHGTVEMILIALDVDGDGVLSFQDVLGLTGDDVIMIARQLAGGLHCRAPDAEVAKDDRRVAELVSGYLNFLRVDLNLGVGNEVMLPMIPLQTLKGDPRGMLRRATFRLFADFVADLETRGPADDPPLFDPDMTGPSRAINDQLKMDLMKRLDRLFPLVQAGLAKPLREELLMIRELADGDPAVPDLITPKAAPRIVFQIDSLLSLPGER